MGAGDAGSRLFHAIVVMGLAFGAGACGGQPSTQAAGDGGGDAFRSLDAMASADAAAGDAAAAADGPAGDGSVAADAPAAPDAAGAACCLRDDAGNCWPCYV
jgi:hypothetical protein